MTLNISVPNQIKLKYVEMWYMKMINTEFDNNGQACEVIEVSYLL